MSNRKTSRRDFITKSTLMAAGVDLGAGVFPVSGKIIGANDVHITGPVYIPY